MDVLKDRRLVLAGGAAVALVAGLAVAVLFAMRQDESDGPPPASEGGLMVQTGHAESAALDPARPLRCFVNGQLIGEMPVSDCARKNGVATGALDVGVDSTGGLAAAKTPAPDVLPPPPAAPPQDQAAGESDQVASQADEDAAGAGPAAQPCWGYGGGGWRRSPSDMSLNACVQSLFAGECVRPGGAAYGRWGDRTLRLVLGRVEIGSDDGAFRTLTRQLGACAIPSLE